MIKNSFFPRFYLILNFVFILPGFCADYQPKLIQTYNTRPLRCHQALLYGHELRPTTKNDIRLFCLHFKEKIEKLTSVIKLWTNPLIPPFSRIDVLSRMKKKFKLPKYFSIRPPGIYARGVMSTPYRSRIGACKENTESGRQRQTQNWQWKYWRE